MAQQNGCQANTSPIAASPQGQLIFSVGGVEGVPFTACTSKSDVIILASNFSQVQQITANSIITALDCSTDAGKIAVAYGKQVVIYDPKPLSKQAYEWVQTATLEAKCPVTVISFNQEGTRLIAGGLGLQLWILEPNSANKATNNSQQSWNCVWNYDTNNQIVHLKYSPDGTLFCSASRSCRFVKVWYDTGDNNNFSFIYIAHPVPITNLEWRRTSKYTSKGAVANVLITSCRDNIARIWVQTLQTNIVVKPNLHFHLAGIIEAEPFDPDQQSSLAASPSNNSLAKDASGGQQSPLATADVPGRKDDKPQFFVHWINNKEIYITRSTELLLHDMLVRLLGGSGTSNNQNSSSTNSPQSAAESCSGSEQEQDELEDPNDLTITAESRKKLRHKLCWKMNKHRAGLAASSSGSTARRNLADPDERNNLFGQTANSEGRTSPTSLVEEFDRTLESLLRKWQLSVDLLFSIDKSNGTLTLWQIKYLDGEGTGLFRSVQIDKLTRIDEALSHYDAITMSLKVIAYSPRAYLDVKRAYLAITSSSRSGGEALGNNSNSNGLNFLLGDQFNQVETPETLSINTDLTQSNKQPPTSASTTTTTNTSTTVGMKDGSAISVSDLRQENSASACSYSENEPSIFIVTQHLSGILGLWKFNFDSAYPKVQTIDLVTRITGLPVDPAWLQDGTLVIEYDQQAVGLKTKWISDTDGPIDLQPIQNSAQAKPVARTNSPSQTKHHGPFHFDEIKSTLSRQLPSVDEEFSPAKLTSSSINNYQDEHHQPTSLPNELGHLLDNNCYNYQRDMFRASKMASSINLLPQYNLKQLIELLAFGKLQRVKAILNHLVNCLLLSENNNQESHEGESVSKHSWAHRSRTLSIVGPSSSAFHDSLELDNPSTTIQQQVVEEIELDYIEVTSIKPLPLYSILDADTEKSKATSDSVKSKVREDFSVSAFEDIMPTRSIVNETLDEILGQSALEALNKQKNLKKIAESANDKGSLTSFNPRKAKLLTGVLTHTRLPGLSNVDQMHLLAVADAVALYDASASDISEMQEEEMMNSHDGGQAGMINTDIAIDSLDDRGLRFLTAMRQHVYLTKCLPMKQRNELIASGIGEHNLVWAFHSESQDELVSLIPGVARNKPDWAELREFGVGWWLKKLEVLKKLIEKVAQSAYQVRQDPLDAALFYLAMKKKTLVCALLRRVNCDKRILKLFEQDFNDPVNRKKALKNAYALLGLHRFEHAAAFFILAGSIWDAVEVCINNLNDIQLAMVLIRLHDSDSNVPNNLKRLLFTEILGSERPSEQTACATLSNSSTLSSAANQQHQATALASNDIASFGSTNAASASGNTNVALINRRTSIGGYQYNYDPKRAHQDPFLRSMAFWKLGDYLSAVHTLLESDSKVSASVFNFYLFLKDQPLVLKHRQQLFEELELRKRTSPVEEEKLHCHRARSLSSGELNFDEHNAVRAMIKQSSTEFEVLNETTRLVDKYSDEVIAEKERRLFFSTASAYLEAGCPLLALEVLCSEDHLDMGRAQRMKFVACLHILMNELNTLAEGAREKHHFGKTFVDWLTRSVEAMGCICSYGAAKGSQQQQQQQRNQLTATSDHGQSRDDNGDVDGESISGDQRPANEAQLSADNEPILRAMLTYCNLHSANAKSLITIRLELLGLINKLCC